MYGSRRCSMIGTKKKQKQTKKKTSSALSLHDALNQLKKRSILNREQDGHGFVSPTDIERKVLLDCKRKMGRAKKQKIDSHNI